MIHLFKKVYVTPDYKIQTDLRRLVISKDHGYPMLEQLDAISYGVLYGYGQSLDDIVSEDSMFGTVCEMFDFLSDISDETDRPIHVYCDPDNMMVVWCNFMKNVFPNMDAKSAWDLYNTLILKEHILATSDHVISDAPEHAWCATHFFPPFESLEEVPAATTGTVVVDTTKVAQPYEFSITFKQAWDSAVVSNNEYTALLKKIIPYMSIEYLMASYAVDKSYTNVLVPIFSKVVQRRMHEICIEVKGFIMKNIFRTQMREGFGVQEIPFKTPDGGHNIQRLYKDFYNEPVIQFFCKSSFCSSENIGQPGSSCGVDFTKLSDADCDKLVEYLYIWARDFDQLIEGNSFYWLADRVHHYKNGTFNETVMNELTTQYANVVDGLRLHSQTHTEQINCYMFDYVLDRIYKKDTNSLLPFKIKSVDLTA